MPYGPTPAGFVPRTEADILAELQDALDAGLGQPVDRSPESVLTRTLSAFARRLAEGWAMAESLYNASDPGLATGLALDDLVAAVGVRRLGAQPSWVSALCLGKAGTKLAAGRVVSASGARFLSVEDAVLAPVWAQRLSILKVEPGAAWRLRLGASTVEVIGRPGQTAGELAAELAAAASAGLADLVVVARGDGVELLARDPKSTPALTVEATAPHAIRVTLSRVVANQSQSLTVSSAAGQVTVSATASDPPVFGTVLANLAGAMQAATWLSVKVASDGRSLDLTASSLGLSLQASGSPALTVRTISSLQDELIKLETISKGAALVRFCSEDTGPVVALRDALSRIETPVSGWDGVCNSLAADLGRDAETDGSLRGRLSRSRQILGIGVSGAIEARIRQDIPGVRSARVVENHEDTPDAAGRPPHSFELVVDAIQHPDTDLAIGMLLESLRPAGIPVVSTAVAANQVPVTWTDERGDTREIVFSRPTRVPVVLSVTLYRHPDEVFPEGAAEIIVERALRWGAGHGVGQDVVIGRLLPILHSFPGVAEVSFTPTGNIPIGPLQIASFEPADGASFTLIPPS